MCSTRLPRALYRFNIVHHLDQPSISTLAARIRPPPRGAPRQRGDEPTTPALTFASLKKHDWVVHQPNNPPNFNHLQLKSRRRATHFAFRDGYFVFVDAGFTLTEDVPLVCSASLSPHLSPHLFSQVSAPQASGVANPTTFAFRGHNLATSTSTTSSLSQSSIQPRGERQHIRDEGIVFGVRGAPLQGCDEFGVARYPPPSTLGPLVVKLRPMPRLRPQHLISTSGDWAGGMKANMGALPL
ncbi:hypothetical protein NLJ89_g11874 [Agrocybe chaxingu]|uniref:Uncharacterized protein n=1 Tax=Agrocybe chaxingu TaxID=84603 RepID=A0A9W8MR77_9AGAR|nr:hypothetical protein NLJ89_g11874 [Agrocybe chaxingu]